MPVAASTVFSIIVTLPVGELLIARNDRLHRRGLRGDRLADVGQIALRHREGHIDRRHLNDGRERRGVGLTHEIADLHVGHADASGDRRADRAEAELNLQIFELRAVGFRVRARDIDLGLRVVERDQRGRVLGDESV